MTIGARQSHQIAPRLRRLPARAGGFIKPLLSIMLMGLHNTSAALAPATCTRRATYPLIHCMRIHLSAGRIVPGLAVEPGIAGSKCADHCVGPLPLVAIVSIWRLGAGESWDMHTDCTWQPVCIAEGDNAKAMHAPGTPTPTRQLQLCCGGACTCQAQAPGRFAASRRMCPRPYLSQLAQQPQCHRGGSLWRRRRLW